MNQFMHDLLLVAKKDLRIEIRSRVIINQVVPFALLVLVLFGFALDADQKTLRVFFLLDCFGSQCCSPCC